MATSVQCNFPTDDREPVTRLFEVVPRIGEHVGVTPMRDLGHEEAPENAMKLDVVLDVRHYAFAYEAAYARLLKGDAASEVHLLLGDR